MNNTLLALLLLISMNALCMEKEKEKLVWRHKQGQSVEQQKTEEEKTIELSEKIRNIIDTIDSLPNGMSHQNTQNIVKDIVFNNYKDKPDGIVELLTVANDLIMNTGNKELGSALKVACINFIANTAFRMSEISSVVDDIHYTVDSWSQQLQIPTLNNIYSNFVSNKSRWLNSDDEINFAKPHLEEQTRKACVWLDSLCLSSEDSELVASTIFEENLNECTAATYYHGNDIPWLALNVVRYSHDDTSIALGSSQGIVIKTGDKTVRFGYEKVIDLSFSPDDRLLAVADENSSCIGLYKIDSSSLTPSEDWKDKKAYISSIPLGLIERRLFENNLGSDIKRLFYGNIPFIEVKSDRLCDVEIVRTFLSGHTVRVLSLDMHSDGKTAISGGADKTVRLWDINNDSAETRQLNDNVTDVGFSSVDKNVFLTASKATKVWDVRSKSPILELSDEAVTIDQSPDGTQLLIAGNIGDGTCKKPKKNGVRIYDRRGAKYAHEYYFNDDINEARFSPKSGEKFFIRHHNGNVQFWVLNGDNHYIKMDRRDLNPGKDFITTACTYSNDDKFAKVGYFAWTSLRNPDRFAQGSSFIERKLSDSSKRKLAKGFDASRALATRYTEAVKEQAQRIHQPKDY